MNTTTNTNRPATAAEALAILFADSDYGLPNDRAGLEVHIRKHGRDASEIEDQMRHHAKVLTAPAPPHAILYALRRLDELGEQYKVARDFEWRAELKLRVVEQVERLYAAE